MWIDYLQSHSQTPQKNVLVRENSVLVLLKRERERERRGKFKLIFLFSHLLSQCTFTLSVLINSTSREEKNIIIKLI